MARLKLEVYISHFVAYVYDRRLLYYIDPVVKKLTSYGFEYNYKLKRNIRVPKFTYCIHHEDEGVFRFPIEYLGYFLSMLGTHCMLRKDEIEIENNASKNYGDKVDLRFKESFKPREEQQEYIDLLTKNERDLRLVDLYTGGGKSLIGMNAVCKIGKRTAIIVLPKYMEKWHEDILKYTYTPKERILMISGSDAVIAIMENIEYYKQNYDFFIFSMRTISNYISTYADNAFATYSLSKYPLSPDVFFTRLGIGTILNDETHQEFYAFYRAMMYFTRDKTICLTATLTSNDKYMLAIQQSLIPTKCRISGIVQQPKYIEANVIRYYIKSYGRKLHKVCERRKMYNHIMWEQFILGNSMLRNDFLQMILRYVKRDYLKRKTTGDKLLIFCAGVNMSKVIAQMLERELPKDLKIGTYIEEDKYEDALKLDVIVSTIISSSTAIDYPNLITTIQTVSLDSKIANIQSLGRLRKLEGKTTIYDCIYCQDLPKQVGFNKTRLGILEEKCKSISYETYKRNTFELELRTR